MTSGNDVVVFAGDLLFRVVSGDVRKCRTKLPYREYRAQIDRDRVVMVVKKHGVVSLSWSVTWL
jgi:hypothetical protein